MEDFKNRIFYVILLFIVFGTFLNPTNDCLKIVSETTGILNTNCYLIYDRNNKNAILIDPADSITELISHIDENDLALEYIFFTHCHPDHMFGVICMNLKEKYPNAKVCFSNEEYEDMFNIVANWKQVYPGYIVEWIKGQDGWLRIFEMDYEKIGKPDIFIEDNQIFKLGDLEIQAIKTPGHARGSVSFRINDCLFTGDELMFGKVGSTQNSPISSFEIQVQSIRKLYDTFPNEIKVFPGHGKTTTIGDEKMHNQNITMDKAIPR